MNYRDLNDEMEFNRFKKEILDYCDKEYYTKASSILLNALEEYPNHSDIFFLLGLVHYNNKDYQRALGYLTNAMYKSEENIEYMDLTAMTYLHLGHKEEALEIGRKAYEEAPGNISTIITMGKIEFGRYQYKDALKYAEEAIEKNSNSYEATRLLSKCYIALKKDPNKTLELLNRAKALGDDDELEFDTLKTMYLSNRFEECIKHCKKIILRAPNSYLAEKARGLISKIKTKGTKQAASADDTECTSFNTSYEKKSDSLEDALDKLNSLIGLENVKDEIQRIVSSIQFESNRAKILDIPKDSNQSYHFVFLGNPGTGKTTVARLIGDIFYQLGFLKKGHLVEVDRSSIVGQYIGQTAQLTKAAITKAQGGVLFIDEAYALAREGSGSSDFGKEAVDVLTKALEDKRGEFIAIFAGYKKEMRELMKLNPGLKSKTNFQIEFDDFNDEQLVEIARRFADDKYYRIEVDGEKAFLEKINREKVDDNFANARSVRNIIEAAIREKAFRLGDSVVSKEEMSMLKPIDFGVDISTDKHSDKDEIMKELNDLIGLENVKEKVREIISFVELQHRKKELGYESEDLFLHMNFLGNPGTGKTTVARIISKILKAIGILKKGHLVEATREDLVGSYIGHTAPKTLDKIKEAYGGVLFIDEAYALAQGGVNDFGNEAISTLIKEMEDSREKLVVIMAGYSHEMKQLMSSNSGIASRVSFTIEFPDYNPDEMLQIFIKMCRDSSFFIDGKVEQRVHQIFCSLFSKRDKSFGNGRLVRKLLEAIKMDQAQRIINQDITDSRMFEILEEDISGDILDQL